MLPFHFYLKLGFEHISNFSLSSFSQISMMDHLMFLIALCAVYKILEWRKLLVLVTAFTIGHSVTLALASLEILTIPSEIIKFLIPVTILLTAISNVLIKKDESSPSNMTRSYLMALFFGFIHGMDFSNYFKALLPQDISILQPLLAFNIGIELGQLLIVGVIVGVGFLVVNILKVKHLYWVYAVSGIAAILSIFSMIENKFW